MVNFDICAGNPGALAFLIAAYDLDMFGAECAFGRMESFGIAGTKLYMLWNDCCGRDTDQALQIMKFGDPDVSRKHINYEGGRGIPFSDEEIREMENAVRRQRINARRFFL